MRRGTVPVGPRPANRARQRVDRVSVPHHLRLSSDMADVLLSQQFATSIRWLAQRLTPEESQPKGDHRP
jgi:hypothetical protein